LDLAALVADVRADRVESLPRDSVFALALVVLACVLAQDELVERLAVPEDILEGAGRHLHAEVRCDLAARALKDLVNETKNTKENDQ
jgi:hypothetical protein